MGTFLQALINGIMMGGVYATIAVGLSLAFGVMGVVNWAHGDLMMLAMYIAYVFVSRFNMDPYLTMIVVIPIMFILGVLLQKFVFNRLLKEPKSIIMWTTGLELIIGAVLLMVFSANTIMVQSSYSSATFSIADIIFVKSRFISFVIAVGCTLLLYFFLMKTETGRALRATAQNREVATLMGINQEKIFNLAQGIAMGLVAIAAALLIPYYPISTTIGITFGTKCFLIVVLGGKGNVLGALVGGLLIGVIEAVAGQYASMAYAQIIVFLLFVAVLLFKPSGILNKGK